MVGIIQGVCDITIIDAEEASLGWLIMVTTSVERPW